MNNEDNIKEVMELVESHGFECALRRAASTQGNYRLAKEFEDKAVELFDRIESKLRELINETHQAGYEAGRAEADEAMSWNRSM